MYSYFKKAAVTIFIVMLFTGCISRLRVITPDDLTKIKISQTTKFEVLDIIGLPHTVQNEMINGEKQVIWIYFKDHHMSNIFTATSVSKDGNVSYGEIPLKYKKKILVTIRFNQKGDIVDIERFTTKEE